MNKRFSSFVCFMLSVLLLLSSVPLSAQAAEMTHEEAYDEYVELLNLYMEASPDASVNIAQLKENFFSMGSYKCSAEFWLYAEVMFHLEENNFSEAMNYATILESYSSDQSAFDLLLKDDDFSSRYAAIRPVSEMMEYIRGRKEEYINNNTTASNHYSECLKFYDARTRYQRLRPNLDTLYDEGLACIRNGDFAKALEIAKSLQERGYEKGDSLYNVAKSRLDMANATPVPVTPEPATPVPEVPVITLEPSVSEPPAAAGDFALNGECHKYSVQLSWNAVSGAASYRVYHAVTRNGQRDFKAVTDTQKTTITHTETSRGVNNYYYVEALDQNGTVLKTSGEAKVYVTPNPTPTPKPTWSAWSSWSATNPGAATSTRQVEKKTQYRYRTSSTSQQWGSWGSWSGWSETAVSKTDSRDVETKQETKTTTTYKYKYTRWKYFNTSENAWWESYCEYTGSSYKPGSGYWQSKTTDTPLNRIETVDGRPVYEGYWYNETKEPVNTSTTVTMFRYRTRSLENVTTWSGWSSWQDASVASSSTCQVETRTVYRYRTLK